MADTQLHLRWHSHGTTFIGMLSDLHMGRSYTDVSLVCDGGVVRAHRAVLSLSSPYLATVLGTCSENDEAPLLLPEVPVQDIRYLISFIYRGQVDVPQNHIASFLNTGKHLQVLGLEQGDQLVDSPCKSEGSSTPGSELDEDPSLSKDTIVNNNKGEKKEFKQPELKKTNIFEPKIECLDASMKREDIKTENEPAIEEGKIDLNYYLQQAIQSASMPCPLCKKEFKSQSGLRDHIRLHTGERPFVCDFCQMNFARASHLKRHRRMHTGEKPFECNVCGKEFSRGDKLKDHLRRHEAEDKLHQIRKQFQNLDESPADQANTVANVAAAAAASYFQQQNSSSSSVSFGTLNPITSLTSVNPTSQFLLNKLTAPRDTNQQPPNKKQCTETNKVNIGNITQFSQSASQVPNILTSQAENTVPSMLGVTSIGECILRPIN
ncbi:Zinc finger and BTB domain-containing protein 14 [Armadillidium nasatum]|uniref:Zinc finger and BTB domain-containing protein 14 n=1 Tax=Armadillidium nasatum TaxID=96803 RepID=A0A5N5TFZ0_9CRUS|nr:Zinc finger and BTB domain-containing protein 14 [Armadillidium nasatum]